MTMSPNVSRRGLQDLPRTELGKIVDHLFADPGERAPVIRSGKRQPITAMVRTLVYRRDGWTCQRCRRTPWAKEEDFRSGVLHLDHIVPWSAGGGDTTDNLRTLCGSCNEERSNYVREDDLPATPIVRTCGPCLAAYQPNHAQWITRAPESRRFDVWCAAHRHGSWAIEGWRVL